MEISVRLPYDPNGTPLITWKIHEDRKAEYIRRYFGKKLIYTDQVTLSVCDILSIYTEQECIENLFKVSKNPDHFSVRPQFQWTDQKIRVHVMLCMFAVAEVLRKKMEENGPVYIREALIEKPVTIHDGWIIHDMKKSRSSH